MTTKRLATANLARVVKTGLGCCRDAVALQDVDGPVPPQAVVLSPGAAGAHTDVGLELGWGVCGRGWGWEACSDTVECWWRRGRLVELIVDLHTCWTSALMCGGDISL